MASITRHANKGSKVRHFEEGGPVPEPKVEIYEIWSHRLGKKVGEATTFKGANRSIDRRDNDYGGYDHYIKRN